MFSANHQRILLFIRKSIFRLAQLTFDCGVTILNERLLALTNPPCFSVKASSPLLSLVELLCVTYIYYSVMRLDVVRKLCFGLLPRLT